MHKKSTLKAINLIVIAVIALFNFMLPISDALAQSPWSGVYGNEWLAGKYGPNWLKISVSQKGIHKVTLPAGFQNKANQLHLYHRGVEVALISATITEVEFYGVPNDGSSDALLYRPYTGVKKNPYYSWFSDESAYFLTFFGTPSQMVAVQPIINASGSSEAYHIQRDLTVYTASDTYDGTQNYVYHSLDQSYFNEGKGRSSKAYLKKTGEVANNHIFPFPFQMKNLVITPDRQPVLEVQVNGRTFTNNSIQASVGKTASNLDNYPTKIEFSDFIPFTATYDVKASSDVNNSNVDANGNGYFQLESLKITDSDNSTGIYSVNYIQTKYPQSFDMTGITSKVFNLLPTANSQSNVIITNAPQNLKVYDITNIHNPRLIIGSYEGTALRLMVERPNSGELNLLVTNVSIEVTAAKISPVTFEAYAPANKDYLIIASENLSNAADSYATYRSSQAGGGYRTLSVKINDVYNQFNYGEPSPIAIRRYVDYMLSSGIRNAHNLLLIGPSTTLWNKMVRELINEVPTIGFPGSDVLLIEGLAGSPGETPAIPIGRISASTETQVYNYLNKVKEYETYPQGDLSWRRKGLHISGGLYSGENTRFANYLADHASFVTNAAFNGMVTNKVKPDNDYNYPNSSLNIAPEVNAGIGFMSYFGHGSSRFTDNNIGYATDGARSYTNSGKYPVMYFNGCGVGNVFNGAFSPFPASASTQIPLSSDWLLAANKGAIAIVANSYYAFETSSNQYLGTLYSRLFKSDSERSTLGQIHRSAARIVMTGSTSGRTMANSYDVANTHQSLLFGDPALRVLSSADPLPVDLISFQATIQGSSQVKLEWKTAWEKGNSHFLIERSYNAKSFEVIGMIEGKGDSNSENSYSFLDTNPNPGNNYYRLVQVDKIENNNISAGKKDYSRIVSVEIPNTSQLTVMPNPTSGLIKIVLVNNLDIKSINIINMNGDSSPINYNGSKEINLGNYPAGVYLLEIVTINNDVYKRKIFKY